MSAFISGFALGFSLILAIGAQNAFVLKQGLKKQHLFLVCLICAASDALLITFGILGFGAVVQAFPIIETVARYGGAVFLSVYGALSIRSAIIYSHALTPATAEVASLAKTVAICLAFTWLNPHVYLDTVVLLGSVSTQYTAAAWQFGLGAVLASFFFFFSLGYGARFFIPLFQKEQAWKILEIVIGLIMFSIAATLLIG